MVGKIAIKQKSTGKIHYVFYSNLSETLLATLRENKEMALFCDCTASEKIELKVGKREETYYLYNAKQGKTESHNPRCPKFAYYTGKSDYEQGWRQDEHGFIANLHADTFAPGEQKDQPRGAAPLSKPYEPRAKSWVNPTTKKGEVTVLGLVTKLNLMAWERCAKKGKLPATLAEFFKRVYGTMKTIRLANKRMVDSLQAMAYEHKKMGEMKPKTSFLFVYMRLVQVSEDPYKSERVKVHCQDTFEQERYFYCAKTKFYEVYESVGFAKKEKQTIVVGGFVYKASEKSTLLTFSSLCLFVTTNLGLYCESSYEREAYDKLCVAHRVFYKPYFSLPEYGDLKPDLLFLDTPKPVIGEIFGFSSPEYLLERARKLQVAQELQEHYGFWKWDAYAQEPFPALPLLARHLSDRAASPDPMGRASSEGKTSSDRQEQAQLKIAPTKEQRKKLAEEFSRQLEEAGYVKVSDDTDEKKEPL